MHTQVRLVADDLILHRWAARDIAELARALDDPEIERCASAIPHPGSSGGHVRAFTGEVAPAPWAGGGAEFAIERSGKALGRVAVYRTERGGEQIGAVADSVAAPARRQRVPTRALRALTDGALGMLRRGARERVPDVHNSIARVVATPAGFVTERVVLDEAIIRDGSPRPVERDHFAVGATTARAEG